jgi:hypothetical protein
MKICLREFCERHSREFKIEMRLTEDERFLSHLREILRLRGYVVTANSWIAKVHSVSSIVTTRITKLPVY